MTGASVEVSLSAGLAAPESAVPDTEPSPASAPWALSAEITSPPITKGGPKAGSVLTAPLPASDPVAGTAPPSALDAPTLGLAATSGRTPGPDLEPGSTAAAVANPSPAAAVNPVSPNRVEATTPTDPAYARTSRADAGVSYESWGRFERLRVPQRRTARALLAEGRINRQQLIVYEMRKARKTYKEISKTVFFPSRRHRMWGKSSGQWSADFRLVEEMVAERDPEENEEMDVNMER